MENLCELCKEFYRKYPLNKDGYHQLSPTTKMSKINCAFKTGIFSSNNWNCATMNKLRNIAKKLDLHYRNDDIGSIGIVPVDIDEFNGFLILIWYKDRGQTEQAILLSGEQPPAMLTIDIATKIIKYWEKKLKSK